VLRRVLQIGRQTPTHLSRGKPSAGHLRAIGAPPAMQALEIWRSAETLIVASGTNWLKDAPTVAGLRVAG
jgi:hypothetical protein